MDIIKNYLDSMFSKLPDTVELHKAKEELGQMMEDKYAELIKEGKSENEAIGTVIAEFGNLDELAEDLGIQDEVHGQNSNPYAGDGTASYETYGSTQTEETVQPEHVFSVQEAEAFLNDKAKEALGIALGVLLCIASPVACCILDADYAGAGAEATGVVLLLVMVAAAIGIFIYSGFSMERWDFMRNVFWGADQEAMEYVKLQKAKNQNNDTILMATGIIICILSAIPSIILDYLTSMNVMLENMGGAFCLIMVAVGVFLIVYSAIRKNGYRGFLEQAGNLQLQEKHGNLRKNRKKPTGGNKVLNVILEVYWPTVTCIYFCWSFLTFDWGITWIIWPVAAVVQHILDMIGEQDEN